MCCFCCPILSILDFCVIPTALKFFGGSPTSPPTPVTNQWLITTASIFTLGLILYIVMCIQCSDLANESFRGILPIDYENSPCYSTENGDLSGLGMITALFMSVGFTMSVISVYYFKVKDGGYKPPVGNKDYDNGGKNANFPEDNV